VTTPDLPAPHEPFTIDAYLHRWPSGAEKVELWAGALVFYGQFDERDIVTAERTFPGRRVVLNEDRGLEVHAMPG
jgi:hypothetical protein